MPVAGTFMRCPHALKPAWTARRRRQTGAMASQCRRSFADRDTGPCDLLRRDLPAWVCNVPDSPTTHPPIRLHRADARPNCRALPEDRASPTWGESGRICVLGELREDGYLQPRPAASAGFNIRLQERWPGTAPVAPPPTHSLMRTWLLTGVPRSGTSLCCRLAGCLPGRSVNGN